VIINSKEDSSNCVVLGLQINSPWFLLIATVAKSWLKEVNLEDK